MFLLKASQSEDREFESGLALVSFRNIIWNLLQFFGEENLHRSAKHVCEIPNVNPIRVGTTDKALSLWEKAIARQWYSPT